MHPHLGLKVKEADRDKQINAVKEHFRTTFKSTPKDIVISSKTLDLIDKYSSYKSIHLSTPKFINRDTKQKNKKFRTKTRSGNSLVSEGGRSLQVSK